MNLSAKQAANDASFQAFMNCYLREIDTGVWHSCLDWQLQTGLSFDDEEIHVLELQLDNLDITLAIGVSFRSLVGRHRLTKVYQQQVNQWSWQAIDTLSAIMLLINNIYSDKSSSEAKPVREQQLELMSRTIESHQVMSQYIEQRMHDPRLHNDDFIDSEQSILYGHWLHPTPKSRQGIHSWQHEFYTPELNARFQAHFFAAERELISQNSILDKTAENIIQDLVAADEHHAFTKAIDEALKNNQVLIPVHPLQAQWLLHQKYVQELIDQKKLTNIGLMGPYFTPTSSVRTLYCEELDYMLKFSIPVKITNSLRSNMAHELEAGVVVAKLLRKSRFSEYYPKFQTIDDPAYISLNLADNKESGFEVIIRDNPFGIKNKNKKEALSIASITQEPLLPGTDSRLAKMVQDLAKKKKLSIKDASLFWFDAYWHCSIEPAIRLYDEHGIALEAHQQNSLLEVSESYPTCYYYRDNQGFYLSQSMRNKLIKQEPGLLKTEDLFYDDAMIRDRFSYYLVINQLFSVINRFALDGLIEESELLKFSHKKLLQLAAQTNGVGEELIYSILNRHAIPCKGNLLTRIDDVDELQADLELAVYTQFKNPLKFFAVQPQISKNFSSQREVHLESA